MQAARRSRRRRERHGTAARHHRADVGGGAAAPGGRGGAARRRRRSSAPSPAGAGLPRNYLAQRVNTRAVEEAQKRRERATAGGPHLRSSSSSGSIENGIDLGALAQRLHARIARAAAAAPARRRPPRHRRRRRAAAAPHRRRRPVALRPRLPRQRGRSRRRRRHRSGRGRSGRQRRRRTHAARRSPRARATSSRRACCSTAGADINQTDRVRLDAAADGGEQPQLPAGAAPDRARRRRQPAPTRAAGRRSTWRWTTATSKAATIRCRSPTSITCELISCCSHKGANPNLRGQGQHADAHHLHDAVVLRGRRHAVHPRRAVERHRADEAAARSTAPIPRR